MIKEDNEKIASCPICFDSLTTINCVASNVYLYHRNCFSKLNSKRPMSWQDFSYYLPVNKVIIDKIYFEKKIENNYKIIIYNIEGFNQDGFSWKGLDRTALKIKRTDENGFNRNEELVCEEKIKKAIRENPLNIYYASDVFRNKNEILK